MRGAADMRRNMRASHEHVLHRPGSAGGVTKKKDDANQSTTSQQPVKKIPTELVTDLVFAKVVDGKQPQVTPVSQPKVATDDDPGLRFSAAHFNIDNIKMCVFEKKSN